MAILLAIAVGFQTGARERANDATAKSNIRTAMPAIEAYRADNGTYAGMTEAGLKSQYSPGVQGIVVVSTGAERLLRARERRADARGSSSGPSGPITQTVCS